MVRTLDVLKSNTWAATLPSKSDGVPLSSSSLIPISGSDMKQMTTRYAMIAVNHSHTQLVSRSTK